VRDIPEARCTVARIISPVRDICGGGGEDVSVDTERATEDGARGNRDGFAAIVWILYECKASLRFRSI